MTFETTEKDISITFAKLTITCNGGKYSTITIFSYFKSKTVTAMNRVREKEKYSDTDALDINGKLNLKLRTLTRT